MGRSSLPFTTRFGDGLRRTFVYFLKLFICGGPEMAPALPQLADNRSELRAR
jgi:hypothetical protein